MNFRIFRTIGLIICSVFLCLSFMTNAQALVKKWETDSLLRKPESAIYDVTNQVVYVSNINGKYRTKDGNGFISRIDTNGNILDLKWADGLDSPQGLGIYKNSLYVADLDRVVEFDISSSRIKHIFNAENAQFLNDLAIDQNGIIYISDCAANKIYRIKKRRMQVWFENPVLKSPNGLLAIDNKLYLLNMGDERAYCIHPDTKAFTCFARGIRNADGLVSDGENGFFASGAWQGEIFHITSAGKKTLILNLGKTNTIAADIEYIPSQRLLLVPTLCKTVIAYRIP